MFNRFPMNLQFFAEEASSAESGAPESTETKENSNPEEQQPQEKTFTQEEVDKMVQKRMARYDRDHQKEIDDAKSEAVKYAKMNKDEKQKHDLEKAQADAKQAREDLARYQLRDATRQQLTEGGYNATDSDIDMIVTGDAETTKNYTQAFLDMVERIRESTRNDLLKGNTPKAGGSSVKVPSEDQFNKMSYQERVDLKNKNPELYDQLANKSY